MRILSRKTAKLNVCEKSCAPLVYSRQRPSLWGDMSPQLLDRGYIISFVPPNIL